MISAQNLRRQLNGSSIILFILFVGLTACSTPKSGAKKPADTTQPSKGKDDNKVRVYDPATGTYVLVPRDAVKVDTIKWTEDKSDPILTDTEPKSTNIPQKKAQYEVSLFIPLNSDSYPELDGFIDAKLLRFLQYYGGMRIAVNEVAQQGLPIKFTSFDTELSITQINEILKDPAVKKSDVIIGPYDKENIEMVASFGLANEKLVISPWLPAFSIDKENPFFIQVLPGLNTHAEAIMNFIGDRHLTKKVYLVARNNPSEIQRLTLFKKNSRVKTEDLIIDDESIDLAKTNLAFLLDDPDGSIFVMPYYSRQDENFINSFLRKLHADKGTENVVVFGLPQWTGFELNNNYMESMSLHISSSTYIDADHSAYNNFRNKFFQTYFTMPDNQAYLGYDLIMWLSRALTKDGPAGLLNGSASEFGLISGYDLKPIYKEGVKKTEIKSPLYYENSKVRILEFRDQDFELVR